MSDIAALIAQRDELDRQIELFRQEQRQDAISKVRAILEESGLHLSDLISALEPGYSGTPSTAHKGYVHSVVHQAKAKKGKTDRQPVAPKYKDPNSGQTWTGRGLRPRWLAAAIASGKTLEDFALKG